MSTFAVVSPEGRLPGCEDADLAEIAFTGTLDEVLEEFDLRLWSDGLPIVPPTIDRIEAMLARTDRDATELIATLYPEMRDACVWHVAVNAVLAGCAPAHFPIVLAVVDALCDRTYRVGDAGSTTGWEPLVALSGSDLAERGFNTCAGVMRVGRRANTSIGRFVRLFLRNVVGLRIPPGDTDMCAIGQPFFPVLAEDEATTRALGWPTLREDHGCTAGDLVAVLYGIVGSSLPIYSGGGEPEPHLRMLATCMAGCSAAFSGLGVVHRRFAPLLVLSPAVAGVFARHGVTKNELRSELVQRAVAPARLVEDGVEALMARPLDLAELVAEGALDERYGGSSDRERQVPVIYDEQGLDIVIAGEAGRNQSRYYVPVGLAGGRTLRVVAQDASALRSEG